MSILVTGASGFVGSEIVRRSLLRGERVIAIIRPRYDCSAEERFFAVAKRWFRHGIADQSLLNNLKVISADLTKYLPAKLLAGESPRVFYHTAAITDFQETLGHARTANVTTTQRLVQLAHSLADKPKIIHVSTAFACGKSKGLINEDYQPQSFYNSYEQSKFESEAVIRHSGLAFVIVRPSIIVGDSKTGYTTHFRVFYSMFRLWFIGILPRAPMDLTAFVDVVPVDYVVSAVRHLAITHEAEGQTFHLCAGKGHVTPKAIVAACQQVYSDKEFLFSPLFVLRVLSWPMLSPILPQGWKRALELFRGHFPYMGRSDRVFCTERSERFLNQENIYCPKFSDFGSILFQFCKDSHWGKKAMPLSNPNY